MEEEVIEIHLTQEEQDMNAIIVQNDFEESIVRDNVRIGHPIKYTIVKSATLNKKVVTVPKYYRLIRNGSTVGYAQFGSTLYTMEYDDSVSYSFDVIGDREE